MMMLLCAPPMWPDLAWSDCIPSFPIWNLENPCSAKLAFCLTSGTLESPAPHLLWGDLKSDQQCLRLWKVSFCLKWELLCDEPVSFRAVPFNFFLWNAVTQCYVQGMNWTDHKLLIFICSAHSSFYWICEWVVARWVISFSLSHPIKCCPLLYSIYSRYFTVF